MLRIIEAVYKKGRFVPLQAVDYCEGGHVQIIFCRDEIELAECARETADGLENTQEKSSRQNSGENK